MMRSAGTGSPVTVSSVVNQSVMCMISLLCRPAGIRPGQRTMQGVRSEPSIPVK